MRILRDSTPTVQAGSAEHWPDWTDDYRLEVNPTLDDAQAASELFNGDDYDTDEPVPDSVLEDQAGEALSQDQNERGVRFY